MPVAVLEEKQKLYQMIDHMGPEDVLRMLDYAAFLRYLEEKEDAEDIAYAREHRDEPTVPFSEVLRDYEDKYGPLD
ncbi:MAG: hypothetical protein ACOX5A_06020 [Aminivibrio sp.]|jgi:hypothetical protein